MRKILLSAFIFVTFSHNAYANVKCVGEITDIYKWDSFDTISILVKGANRWISMPTKSDESMALLAFASSKTVTLQWVDPDIASCTNGWPDNKKFTGWFKISQ